MVLLHSLTAGQLVIGELVPKSLALQHPTGVAFATIVPMRWSLAIFRPFTALLNATARLLVRLFGSTAATHHHVHSPEEIELLMAESREGGLLEPDEHRRLRSALRLGLRTAPRLMVPLGRADDAAHRHTVGGGRADRGGHAVQPAARLPGHAASAWSACSA